MESDDSEDEAEEAEHLDSQPGTKQGPGAGASLESNHAGAEGRSSGQTQSDIMRFNAWGFNSTPRKGYNVESFQSPDGSMGSASARSKGEELQSQTGTSTSASHGPSKMKGGSAIKVLSRDAILSMVSTYFFLYYEGYEACM
jgi:hypothetical protein